MRAADRPGGLLTVLNLVEPGARRLRAARAGPFDGNLVVLLSLVAGGPRRPLDHTVTAQAQHRISTVSWLVTVPRGPL